MSFAYNCKSSRRFVTAQFALSGKSFETVRTLCPCIAREKKTEKGFVLAYVTQVATISRCNYLRVVESIRQFLFCNSPVHFDWWPRWFIQSLIICLNACTYHTHRLGEFTLNGNCIGAAVLSSSCASSDYKLLFKSHIFAHLRC